jgi:Protein of unknown function (DUF2612)
MSKYTDLITSEHSQKPKFVATVDVSVSGGLRVEEVLDSFTGDFDLDTAIGAQLDVIGEWVGRSRLVSIPLTDVYFVLDGYPGLDEGAWQGPYDPDSGLVALDDESYRFLIRAKIAANSWDGTIPSAYAVWQEAFNDGSIIIIQDNQDMSMVVGIAGMPPNAVTTALISGGYIPLKPAGVRVNYWALAQEAGPIFALDVDGIGPALAGFDLGNWAAELPGA